MVNLPQISEYYPHCRIQVVLVRLVPEWTVGPKIQLEYQSDRQLATYRTIGAKEHVPVARSYQYTV